MFMYVSVIFDLLEGDAAHADFSTAPSKSQNNYTSGISRLLRFDFAIIDY